MRVLVIGLDCATPQLVFGKWLDELPNIKKLASQGAYGKLKSVIPPITCPAWMCMVTSKPPNRLGVYGFRNRKGNSYKEIRIANSSEIKEKTVWDILSGLGKKSIVVGVPQTFPPKPLNGYLVTSFLTPSTNSQFTYPEDFRNEVLEVAPGYMLDVENFRTDRKDGLLKEIYDMTEKRFKLMNHLLKTKEWDFGMVVEMGPDRMHHAFWKYFDEKHKKYVPGNKYGGEMLRYYRFLDGKIGELLEVIDDDTAVLVVSDHGAKPMKGCLCINEWLIKEGYLKLKSYPSTPTKFGKCEVDWENTKAWGWGGYYSRVFLNVEGREEQGIIPQEKFNEEREELIRKLRAICDPEGRPMNSLVDSPEDIYHDKCEGETADIMAFFDDLYFRAAGTIGHNSIYLEDNDTGPDDAVHDWHGIFAMRKPGAQGKGEVKGISLIDIAPTVLSLMDVGVPKDMVGKVITW
ncbi:MAG: alkaline phosphatase family protein [Candidatus Micrarchaeota archaeon]